MLSPERIKEAESNIKRYINENLLKKEINRTAQFMYMENSETSLQTAQKLLLLETKEYNPSLWVIDRKSVV